MFPSLSVKVLDRKHLSANTSLQHIVLTVITIATKYTTELRLLSHCSVCIKQTNLTVMTQTERIVIITC